MKRAARSWWVPGLAAALFAAAAWTTPGLWLRLDGWVQDQRDRVWQQVEALVGQAVVYDRIAPTILSALDFQRVRILRDDGSPLLSAASMRFSWDWGRLLQGRFAEALRKIQLVNPVLSLDSAADAALLERWRERFGSGRSGSVPDLEIEAFNLTAKLTDGTRTVNLERFFAVLAPQEGRWSLRYRGSASWEARDGPLRAARLTLRGDLRADADFAHLSLRTETGPIRTDLADLQPLTLQVLLDPEALTVIKVADQIPLDLKAVFPRSGDPWTVTGAAASFRLSSVLLFKGRPTWAAGALGTLTGRFRFSSRGDFTLDGSGLWPAGTLPPPFDRSDLRARGRVDSGPEGYRLSGFSVESGSVGLSFDGLLNRQDLFPSGRMELTHLDVPGLGSASGVLVLTSQDHRIVFGGRDLTWNSLVFPDPDGWIERGAGTWAVHARGGLGSGGGVVGVDGTFEPAASRFTGQVGATLVPLADLRTEAARLWPDLSLPDEVWALTVSASTRLIWGQDEVQLPAGTFEFVDPQQPARAGRGSLSWGSGQGELRLANLSWDGLRAAFRVGVTVEPDGPLGLRWEGSVLDRSFDLRGRWVPLDHSLVFAGSPGLSGLIHQDDTGLWTADLTLEPYRFSPGWSAAFRGRLTWGSGGWSCEVPALTVEGPDPLTGQTWRAQSALHADNSALRLEGLSLSDAAGTLSGAASTTWSADGSRPWTGSLGLRGSGPSPETVDLSWTEARPQAGALTLRSASFNLGRLGWAGLTGQTAVSGDLRWNGPSLVWKGQVALLQARYGEVPLGLRAAVSGTESGLAVRGLTMSLAPVRLSDASLDANWAARTWKGEAGVALRLGASDWEARWSGQGAWSGAGSDLAAELALKGRVNVWGRRSLPDWAVTARWSPAAWQAELVDGGLSAQGGPGGRFEVLARAPFPVRARATGVWRGPSADLTVNGFQADLALVHDLVSSPFLAVTGGTATGDFSLSGPVADPDVTGRLVLRDVTAESSFVRRPLGPFDMPVTLEGHLVRVDAVNIAPPGQTWLVSGNARLDHLLPEEYQFAVQTDSISIVPVSYQYTGLSAQGGATGTLTLRGTPLSVTLGGRLLLQDAVITLKQNPGPAAAGQALGFNADLTLLTGRRVEFLWPNETLPLIRAVTAPGQTLTVKANDLASTWSVTGRLALRTGEINYLNRTFVLKEGQLGFQESQAGFDPRIVVRAEWKLRETSGTTTVNLRADGTLSRFSPRFDAVPFKSAEELQQLVGTTLALPTDYTKATSVDTALSVASDVGTSFLLTPFEETVKKNFNLDLFTVQTEILKKSLLSRNAALDASDYLDNTRLFFGKYIGDDLFLQGTLAFRRDGSTAVQGTPRMVMEPEFQLDFQTPFFLFNWTLLPQHPETLFVTDNTVTFRWNWSY